MMLEVSLKTSFLALKFQLKIPISKGNTVSFLKFQSDNFLWETSNGLSCAPFIIKDTEIYTNFNLKNNEKFGTLI